MIFSAFKSKSYYILEKGHNNVIIRSSSSPRAILKQGKEDWYMNLFEEHSRTLEKEAVGNSQRYNDRNIVGKEVNVE